MNKQSLYVIGFLTSTLLIVWQGVAARSPGVPLGREEVVFWHFWGGSDRPIVEEIVERFNQSQDRYWVRAIAMPGSNLDLKFFLSVAGGDPPDLLNQDDPIVADWGHRGVLTPLDELATEEEIAQLKGWLFPAAKQLGSYNNQLYALCNGLDIRALYCNETLINEHGLDLPKTTDDLDLIAEKIAPSGESAGRERMGYLPDPRRIWAWGIVFGGSFANLQADQTAEMVTADTPEIVEALTWMAGYSRRYGPSEVAAFRSGEQALTGASFPILANRRYAAVMDGQWRVRDLEAAESAANKKGETLDQIVAVPLPVPPGGRSEAGWVNGNFFVVPKLAHNKPGAWEFMKFWSGFDGNEAEAARACAAGGWIPASQRVVEREEYQQAIERWPLLETFVQLAASENQVPIPALPVASLYNQEVVRAAQEVLYRGAEPEAMLKKAAERVRTRLQEVLDDH